MAKRSVTLGDVAALAQVDVSTVSRILRGDESQRVRDDTKKRVLDAAARLKYRPNALARGLRTSKSSTIGLVVPQLENPVFSAMIYGAEEVCAQNGYSLIISHRELGRAGKSVSHLSQMNRVDGLLVASFEDDTKLKAELLEADVPVVLMNKSLDGVSPSVIFDGCAAAKSAVQHLIALGHRRIAHLSGRAGGMNARQRIEGYKEALAEAGIEFDPALVSEAGYTVEGGKEAMRRLLDQDMTAVFAATLVSAGGAMKVLQGAGKRIPEDVSVISLHDEVFAELLTPELTTVPMPTVELGRIAATLLIRRLSGDEQADVAPLPPGDIKLRKSTGPASGALSSGKMAGARST